MIDGNKLLREIGALGLACVTIFLILSLATYSAQDPSLTRIAAPLPDVVNAGGIIGAYVSGLAVDFLGLGAWLLPGFSAYITSTLIRPHWRLSWLRWLGLALLIPCMHVLASAFSSVHIGDIHGGGYLGHWLHHLSITYLHAGGSFVVWSFVGLVGVQVLLKLSWSSIWFEVQQTGRQFGRRVTALAAGMAVRVLRSLHRLGAQGRIQVAAGKKERDPSPAATKRPAKNGAKAKAAAEPQPLQDSPKAQPKRKKAAASPKSPKSTRTAPPVQELSASHDFPPAALLDPVPAQAEDNTGDLSALAEKLSACLEEFGVQGTVVETRPGPVVTMIEIRPAPGIKISRIANLNDDLALALKASAVRIEAPIPGKDLVGVEIPNQNRKTVYFRSIIESDAFQDSTKSLSMALGQDIQGQPRVESLAKMPHLLVAGATGAGKSVCLNSILTSLLISHSPEELKLMLIDPKRIEMAPYADLPHLIHPVVTEMDLAKTALEWAVHEMDRRYQAMARLSVRNIESYNAKLAEFGNEKPEEIEDLEPMPFLMIVIDELADLMLTAGKEAEASIVRLAQLARAAGLHLIIATQRPSVDVVTGLIKANFPARIAFQVSSKHDSRTILDSGGAEYLLGMGDMLFKSSAGRMERIHGAFISDNEINAVIDFWKHKFPSPEQVDLSEWRQDQRGANGGGADADVSQDPLYDEAVESVINSGKASISMIQRQMRIGFNRAARFIEQMERDGIIGPQEGSKPRTVIKQG